MEEVVCITEDACWSIVVDVDDGVVELAAPKPNPVVPNLTGPCESNEPNPLLPVLLPPLNADTVGIEDCQNTGVAVCPNAGFPRALVRPNADVVVLEPKDGCPNVAWDIRVIWPNAGVVCDG